MAEKVFKKEVAIRYAAQDIKTLEYRIICTRKFDFLTKLVYNKCINLRGGHHGRYIQISKQKK